MAFEFKRGDVVVFARQKHSTSPGPRAKDVTPASAGDTYTYVVDKYWLVAGQTDSGELQLLTRTGKQHLIAADDFRLRRPTLWERIFRRHRFPSRDLLSEQEQIQ